MEVFLFALATVIVLVAAFMIMTDRPRKWPWVGTTLGLIGIVGLIVLFAKYDVHIL